MSVRELELHEICRRCDPARLPFETTDALEALDVMIGQPRAAEAMRFGLGVRRKGYNLFVLGSPGTGRHSVAVESIERRAATEAVPSDWCYVQDFEQWHRPRALKLAPGEGMALRKDIERFIEELGTAVPALFESEEYRSRRMSAEKLAKAAEKKVIVELEARAREHSLAVVRTGEGYTFTALKEAQPLAPDEMDALSPDELRAYEESLDSVQDELNATLDRLEQVQKELSDRVDALDRTSLTAVVAPRIEKLAARWSERPAVIEHLRAIERDVVKHIEVFLPDVEVEHDDEDGAAGDEKAVIVSATDRTPGEAARRRYEVNVLVDRTGETGAPVIYEDLPTHGNLVGRVEHVARMGALMTDFRFIKAGALHRANGGYLVLDVGKLVGHQGAWEGLKRALQAGEVRIETLERMLTLATTRTLEPEAIALDVKVVLVGERDDFYQLDDLDPEFRALFKVAVDFHDDMPRTPESEMDCARWVATYAKKYSLRPFDRYAVARVIEWSSRLAEDSTRLSTRFGDIAELLVEADHHAAGEGRAVVTGEDVVRADRSRTRRVDRVRDLVLEQIRRGVITVDVAGRCAGQVNALAVIDFGDFAFAHPSRVTARVGVGTGQVIDIERETDLGGPIHTKGVMILTGLLVAKYAPDLPLSLWASLVFEQSYIGIDGDSASSAELYALLSALADVPLMQSRAVTGAIDQRGRVQAVGGVNEKIEGFFDVCMARGLTGDQGVVIPVANREHLMLRDDVLAAVEAGRFHLWTVETVDEGMELLTGLPAGERGDDGRFPPGSVNARVEERLLRFAARRRDFLHGAR
jgi:lon-related putative ATP-dependent protease